MAIKSNRKIQENWVCTAKSIPTHTRSKRSFMVSLVMMFLE